VTNTK